MGSPRGPCGPQGPGRTPRGPGSTPTGPWGSRGLFCGPRRIFLPASKRPKTVKVVNDHKQPVETYSKSDLGCPKPFCWLSNPGSLGDPLGISVRSWGERSARDSKRVVSSIHIYKYMYVYVVSLYMCIAYVTHFFFTLVFSCKFLHSFCVLYRNMCMHIYVFMYICISMYMYVMHVLHMLYICIHIYI